MLASATDVGRAARRARLVGLDRAFGLFVAALSLLLAVARPAGATGPVPVPVPRPAGAPSALRPETSQLYAAVQRRAPRLELLRATAADHRADLDAFAGSRWGTTGAPALSALRAMSPRFAELVVDPGVVTRLPQFRAFVAAHPELRSADPWAARGAFADSLGHRTVYRALMLRPEDLPRVEESGLTSRFVRMPGQLGEASRSLQNQIDERVRGWPSLSEPLVSVAKRARVAASVAGRPLAAVPELRERGNQVYLFRAKVPAIDVFARGARPGAPLRVGPESRGQTLTSRWADAHGVAHERTASLTSPETESFILYGIDPNEIVSKRQVPLARAGTYEITRPAAAPVATPATAPAAASAAAPAQR